ncbi:SusC/RagA family TonB-linked outer membrane protein [Pedobacter frigidisoli]|uniref:SusC/RagA family TonB-linked outer membrane protein n=1 Tax=Pedobacter frigidisoli TaxID=2530455 RepID=UPI00293122B5|nr:SusC/RagA family TonB-linked outer membrane protein [Pedobacter frigidisoli]
MNFSAIAVKYRDCYVQCIHKKLLIDFMRITSFIILVLTISAQMLVASSVRGQQMEEVRVKLKLNREGLSQALEKIEKQTPFHFIYRDEEIREIPLLNLSETTTTLDRLLSALLANSNLTYKQIDRHIVITKKVPVRAGQLNNANPMVPTGFTNQEIQISGKVTDEKKVAIPGASVWVVGTKISSMTNSVGNFSLIVPDSNAVLEIRFVGYKTRRVTVRSGGFRFIQLEVDQQNLDEVVINNGLFDRKVGTSTGATSTFNNAQLKVVTNQNLIAGLAILDPSFVIVENNNLGSNPNNLPDVQMRGQTGFPNVGDEFANAPNLPLFILDGFETTLQRIYDLNINLIKSVTLLKDASAKAIYGSKAGNGVVVVETIKPEPGALRVSYSGSLNFTAPDLSSYKLTNSAEKIQAETLAGRYISANPVNESTLTAQYAINQKAALEGVDSYWLSQPLQNGYGQRHSVMVDGGDQSLRYSANMSYNNNIGVMKGSNRETISGSVNLSYVKEKFSFNNILTIDRNNANNSPYGSFAEYAKMNPYWRIRDEFGRLIPTYTNFGTTVYNPLYNGELNSKDNSKYTNIVENFYTEWRPSAVLRFTGRVGINLQNNSSDNYISANNTRYASIPVNSDLYQQRGQYTITNGRNSGVSSDIGAAYTLNKGKHQAIANAIYSITQNITNINGMTAVGFPNDNLDFISAGGGFAAGSKPTGSENTARTMAVTTAVNYAYDNRFLTDLSYRANASSQFGANNRWGSFWSAGLGWNVHNESFLKNLKGKVDMLKLRASIGSTGTQNFSAYEALTSYRYNTTQNYNGDVGFNLISLANPDLRWQKVMDKNVGLDLGIFQRLSLRFDFYIKDTQNLLSDQILPLSTGFTSYKENIGEVRNQGFQIGANLRVYNNTASRTFVNVFVNAAHNTNKIRKVSSSLEQLNTAEDANKLNTGTNAEERALRQNPSTRYVPGQSMSTIWVVPSLGIDPSNGKEIFLKRDGSQTYIWSAADYVAGGDTNPYMNGTFGSNVRYKDLTVNFAFAFRLGGQAYNTSLVQKVENADFIYNVDIRALQQRWSVPGQAAIYKDIADITPTKPTSRFVQNLSELNFSSVSIAYDFNKLKFLGPGNKSRISVALNLNDIARIATVKTERGLDYPYARTVSMSVQANF